MKLEYEHTSNVSKTGPDRFDEISDLKSARHDDLIIARFLDHPRLRRNSRARADAKPNPVVAMPPSNSKLGGTTGTTETTECGVRSR